MLQVTGILLVLICTFLNCEAAPSENTLQREVRNIGFENNCDCECGLTQRPPRVVGGIETKPNEFPWLVGLYQSGQFYCGGSLISKKHILTAAHCVKGFNIRQITVVLGDHDRENSTRFSSIEVRGLNKAKPHERYDEFSYNNDIAIIELSSAVEFNDRIQSICLPNSDSIDYTGHPAVVAGWGKVGERLDVSRVVRKAVVPVWSKSECYGSDYGEKKLSENMFCAGYVEGNIDACRGDSGGPLHDKAKEGFMELIGIVSWGRGCGRPNLPGIYTKVANYLDWILENLGEECLCARPNQRKSY